MLIFFISSCEKQEGVSPARIIGANMVITPPVAPSPLPTAGYPINVNFNGQLLHNNISYGAVSGVITNSIVSSKDSLRLYTGSYSEVMSGNAVLGLSIAGADPLLFNRLRNLEAGKSYTAVALHLTPFLNVAVLEDNLAAPAPGKAHIRLVHAIPPELLASVPRRDTVDFTFTGGLATNPIINSAIFANRRFADNLSTTSFNGTLTQFVSVDTGRYSLGLRIAGTPGLSPATGLLGGWQTLRLENQRIYTIIARLDLPGLLVGRPAGLTVIRHN